MTAKEILKREFGADAQEIENEIQRTHKPRTRVRWRGEDIAEILMDYGLEMDYIFDFIGV